MEVGNVFALVVFAGLGFILLVAGLQNTRLGQYLLGTTRSHKIIGSIVVAFGWPLVVFPLLWAFGLPVEVGPITYSLIGCVSAVWFFVTFDRK